MRRISRISCVLVLLVLLVSPCLAQVPSGIKAAPTKLEPTKKVTLTLKEATVSDALKLLFKFPYSYVLTKDVSLNTKVTASLNGVDFSDALAAICSAADLEATPITDKVWRISAMSPIRKLSRDVPVIGAVTVGGGGGSGGLGGGGWRSGSGATTSVYPTDLPTRLHYSKDGIATLSPVGSDNIIGANHPSFKGEDKLIDLDVKDIPLPEVAAKLSHKVPLPAPGEVHAGMGNFELYRSLEIIVDDSIRNLKVSAKIHKWPLGNVLDLLLDQANLVCSREDVLSEPILAKGYEKFPTEEQKFIQVPITKLYLVPKPELTISGISGRPYERRVAPWQTSGAIGGGGGGFGGGGGTAGGGVGGGGGWLDK